MILVVEDLEIFCGKLVLARLNNIGCVFNHFVHVSLGEVKIVGVDVSVHWGIQVKACQQTPDSSFCNTTGADVGSNTFESREEPGMAVPEASVTVPWTVTVCACNGLANANPENRIQVHKSILQCFPLW